MSSTIDLKKAIAYLKPDLSREESPALALAHDESPVLRDWNNGLLVSYLVDGGNRFTYVQNKHLVACGISENQLHEVGINNLYTMAEKHLRIQQHGSVHALFMEGNFEASVLLLDTVWDISIKNLVREDFVAAVPTRDVLAFGDSSSPQAIKELHDVVGRLQSAQADHRLSTNLYRRKEGRWLVWGS